MPNPTINVTLSSLKPGTVPSVTVCVTVNQGGNVDVNATWPSSGGDTIKVDLDFSKSKNQDPFNDIKGGNTSFSITKPTNAKPPVHQLTIKNNATVGSDTYKMILTVNGETYSTDPTIIVSTKPPRV